MRGVFKYWNDGKAYGFITSEEDCKDYFTHAKYCKGFIPSVGDNVEFELGTSERGDYCYDVKKVREKDI